MNKVFHSALFRRMIDARRRLRTIILIALAGSVAAAGACNTTEGVGKDVKSLGRGVEDAARDAK